MRNVPVFPAAMASLVLAACVHSAPSGPGPQDAFFASLGALCGEAFAGERVSNDPIDADFGNDGLVMHVRSCSADEIRIPFHVGGDRSRTWVITRMDNGLRLKHDHRHGDGNPDILTQYGGDTAGPGRAVRQEFPADDYSQGLFLREGIPASIANVWAVEVTGDMFAYELARPGRFFRVEFDLTRPVATPPDPWGAP